MCSDPNAHSSYSLPRAGWSGTATSPTQHMTAYKSPQLFFFLAVFHAHIQRQNTLILEFPITLLLSPLQLPMIYITRNWHLLYFSNPLFFNSSLVHFLNYPSSDLLLCLLVLPFTLLLVFLSTTAPFSIFMMVYIFLPLSLPGFDSTRHLSLSAKLNPGPNGSIHYLPNNEWLIGKCIYISPANWAKNHLLK